jgi:hypothetical protein
MEKQKALIYKSELEFIDRCIRDYPDIETGGDLFGFWTYSGYPVVQYVIGPGLNARRTTTFFQQDEAYLLKTGTILNKRHGLQHIGEWHSHHKLSLAYPSGHDVSTVVKAIKDCGLQKFYLCIATIQENHTFLNGFMFKEIWGRNFLDVDWVVLEVDSPIRFELEQSQFADIILHPKTKKSFGIQVRRTNLITEEYVKPNFSKAVWLKTEEGKKELKKIYDDLSAEFGTVRMFINNDETLLISFNTSRGQYEVLFEKDYPSLLPSIYRVDEAEKHEIVSSIANKNQYDTLNYIYKNLK